MLIPLLATLAGVDAVPDRDAARGGLDGPLAVPNGYRGHRPLLEFFTGLSCPSCMAGPHPDIEGLYASTLGDEAVPWTYVAFHELNGGGVDGLATDESRARMRYYQPGVSGTPDAEIDGGWSELGGMYRKPTPNEANAQSAIDAATVRYQPHLNPRQPIRGGLLPDFKFVNLEVEQYYQDGEWAVVVNVTYLGMGRILLNRDLRATLTVFMVEDSVVAWSKVEGADTLNHNVFRGYALQDQAVTLGSGENQLYAGSWKVPNITVEEGADYPEGTPVPIKSQDVVAVAALFDSDDTSSADGVNGNPNAVPRCVQSATPNSTAYDRGNAADPVGEMTFSDDKGALRVEAHLGDPDGASTAAVFFTDEGPASANWTAVTMSLTGDEVCDDTGACYAYSDATASAPIDPGDATTIWLVVLYTDGKGALGRSDVVTHDVGAVAPGPTSTATVGTWVAVVALAALLVFMVFTASRSKDPTARKAIAGMTVVVLVLGGALLGSGAIGGGSGGDKVPDIRFTDLDGDSASLGDFKGKVVVIDMMATWCPDCQAAMKDLKEVHKRYGDRIVMLTVDIDPKESAQQLAAFKAEYGAGWRFTMDNGDQEFMAKFSVKLIPLIIVIDVRGRAVYSHEGAVPAKDLSSRIDKAQTGGGSFISIGAGSTSSLGLALWAVGVGAITFVSPCAFPMLPGYVTFYLQQEGPKGTKRALRSGLAAASGLVLLYMVIAVLVGLFGSTISAYIYLLTPIVGLLLISMAAVILLDIQLNFGFLTYPVRKGLAFSRRAVRAMSGDKAAAGAGGGAPADAISQAREEGGDVGLFYYGLGYGAASAGCMAPVVIALIFLAASQGTFLSAMLIFAIYALTMAALMVVITMGIGVYGGSLAERLRVSGRAVKLVSGLLLVAVGVWMLYFFASGSA
jgi:cytochrome c-type biogenesis protein